MDRRRFYTFMDSPKLPWERLWERVWRMIPNPLTEGRLLIALDDFINPKTGKKIFSCSHVFGHAAKLNQAKYPWAQNVVSIGLLKLIKNRWTCLPLAFLFYHMKKDIQADYSHAARQSRSHRCVVHQHSRQQTYCSRQYRCYTNRIVSYRIVRSIKDGFDQRMKIRHWKIEFRN